MNAKNRRHLFSEVTISSDSAGFAAGTPDLAGRMASSGIVAGTACGRYLAVDKPYSREVVRIDLVAGHLDHHHRRSVAETGDHRSADTLGPVGARPADLQHLAELVLGPDGLDGLYLLRPFWRPPPPSFVLSTPFESL